MEKKGRRRGEGRRVSACVSSVVPFPPPQLPPCQTSPEAQTYEDLSEKIKKATFTALQIWACGICWFSTGQLGYTDIAPIKGLNMEKGNGNQVTEIFETWGSFMRKCIFSVLSFGPIPCHIAFIMDGNRRYAKTRDLVEGDGHRTGFSALMSMLRYCYELGVKYVTIYAFSIDNFKRRPEEVQSVMQLLQEKIETLIEKESMVNQYGIRVNFIGNLELLSKPLRSAAKRAMLSTAGNSAAVLSVCIAYTSTNEIVHAVEESCAEKWEEVRVSNASCDGNGFETDRRSHLINVVDIEKHMYMAVAPHPDIIIRTSGESRLSNFLLWQSASCLLYSPSVLWPEIGFRHLVWATLNFQRNFWYLKEKKKQA